MTNNQKNFIDLMYRFKNEHEFSNLYEVIIERYADDDYYIYIGDKRDDSIFFEFAREPLDYDYFIKILNENCESKEHKYSRDYIMLRMDLLKLIRENKLKEFFSE